MRRVKPKKDPKKASLQSTQVAQRRRAVTELVASFAVQGDTAASSLEARLEAVLEAGEEMPDLRLLFRLLERLAQKAGEDLERVDGERFVRAMRLRVLQAEIRRTKAELRVEVVRVRKALVDLYGSARVRFQFGLAERTPRGTADLANEAWRLLTRLGDPDLVLPETQAPGLVPDPEGWLRSLRPATERLNRLLNELERRRVGASDGILDQHRMLEAFDETYLRVARTAEELLRLAGEEELARRLRRKAKPRRRRSGIVRVVVRGWGSWLAGWNRFRAFLKRGAHQLRGWARRSGAGRGLRMRKTRGFPLARGLSEAPNP